MSLRGKGQLGKKSLKKRGKLKKMGSGLLSAAQGMRGMRGRAGVPRRRHSRGITARQFRTAQRVLKKIVKMYSKLPRRAGHHATACSRRGR